MAAGEEKNGDFYSVLGLKKECSDVELRNAYKKLAMRWHPDKCSNGERMEEAKGKFQEIQKAYSVLSDSSKRFLYDVGVYDDEDDDDENGMGDFLGEMAQMMTQNKSNEGSGSGSESFEELQRLFVELFQDDPAAGFSEQATSSAAAEASVGYPDCSSMNSGKSKLDDFGSSLGSFCHGLDDRAGQSTKGKGRGSSSKRRNGRKQNLSSKHDVSSCDT